MNLAWCWNKHQAELIADLQEFFNVNAFRAGLSREETTEDVIFASILLSQLPRKSRIVAKMNPDAIWADEAYLLRQIDYTTRVLSYQLGRNKGKKPKPIKTPAEIQRKQEIANTAQARAADILFALKDVLPDSCKGGE